MMIGEELRNETINEAQKRTNRFVLKTFCMSNFASLIVATLYVLLSPSADKPFHVLVIMGAGGITIPMFMCTMRLMTRGYYLSLIGWESTKRLVDGYDNLQKATGPVVDDVRQIVEDVKEVVEKSRPITDNVGEIVERAKTMSADVEKIANKVRSTADALNGNLDLNRLINELHQASQSLDVIADAFKTPGGSGDAFDFKVGTGGRGRRKR